MPASPPTRPGPELIAHRGTPREHPENSLAGFAQALAYGVDGIELDVHVTADGVAVVHHDAELGRVGLPSPLAGRAITDLDLDELRPYQLAPGEPIPTLEAVLDLVGERATVYVEVKAPEARVAVAVLVGTHHARTAVHAFDHRVPALVRRLSPATPIGLLSESYLLDTAGALRAAGARDWWSHWRLVDAALVHEVHAAGGRLIAWTVNDPAAARHLATLGVDGICTDLPGVIGPALGRPATTGHPAPNAAPRPTVGSDAT